VSEIEKFFNDDPWQHITSPIYPNGQRLYQKDERFWVSMDASDKLIFFIRESGKYTIKKLKNFFYLTIYLSKQKNSMQQHRLLK